MLANNKQVNVWRGDEAPPTIHHIWIKNDTELYLYNEEIGKWVTFLASPALRTESLNGTSVKLFIGDNELVLNKFGTSLSIEASGNTITFRSSALTTIATSGPLSWDGTTLQHLPSGAVSGIYGAKGDMASSTITIPSITVNETGHIVSITDLLASIPAVVDLIPVRSEDTNIYLLLLSSSSNENRETGAVLKTLNLSFNFRTKTLSVENIDVTGNVTINLDLVVRGTIKGNIQGNVSGTATPINHADPTDRYGRATTEEFGHVKLQDNLSEPESDSGIAATPAMVQASIAASLDNAKNLFGGDFYLASDGKFYIAWID